MIAIIKYGAGNTKSVMNALDRIGARYILTDKADEILNADRVIFPGVGHAEHAMQALAEKGLDSLIKEVKRPLLGICVGMQLLYDRSEEGNTKCLGIVEGVIRKFEGSKLIVPQIGWNTVDFIDHPLFSGLDQSAWFYAVHSYYAAVGHTTISTSVYGNKYSSAIQKENFYGVQFHPEKSSKNGQIILQNFMKL